MIAHDSTGGESHSRDSVILVFDGPSDNQVRPCRPERLAFLKAESEKIKRYEAMRKEREAKEKEPKPKHPDDGTSASP